MGRAKDLVAAGLTSAETIKANGAASTTRCCVVYRVDPLQALCLPGVTEMLGESEDAGAESRRWTMPTSAELGS